jgi:dTDP-4-dehydrorhamnose reductase
MRILVIGGNGMLGHEAARTMAPRHEIIATVRKHPSPEVQSALAGCQLVGGVDVLVPTSWRSVLAMSRAQVVLNCAGIVKQRAADETEHIAVNALFPHQLASACQQLGVRLIHISTDCVFSGRRGGYTESDEPDPVDLYGRSKLLGELDGRGSLTIRTSMIGLELGGASGLVEWYLAQPGKVNGYRRAIWSGFTTSELARVLERIIERHTELHGVWHVSNDPINKYDLLRMLTERLGRTAPVVPDDRVVIDRSLNSVRFRQTTGYEPPSHDLMLDELAAAIRVREEHRVA